ncbi:MAG: type IV toxin-antitoxin system AbiEi family antitoxin domain-containing protein [Bacilli bacterium]|nr:type IV toxin-antitoxin system AbiEi family antitoxin domain-containing protein [Bacilli bacterium]
MKTMNIKEFKEKSNIEIIVELMNKNNGYITSKLITGLGIHRMYLNILQKEKVIEKVANGVYMDVNKLEDSYYVFSISTPNAVFSHMMALYFYGLSIKAPSEQYDITVCNNYFNYKIKNHNVFYVSEDIYKIGLTEVETPAGNKVKAYDMERCICDIIRSKKRMDIELVKYSVKEYLKRKDKDLNKLSIYADKMGINNEVMGFVSIMYE